MKAIRIRLRWLNIGAALATALYLWLEAVEAEQKDKLKSTNTKFDDIVKHYQEKYDA